MNFSTYCKRSLIQALAIITCIFLFSANVIAHSGRTDGSGGHRDNQNKSGLGSYHYHCGGNPPHLHSDGGCPYSSDYEVSEPVVATPTPSISLEQFPSELNVGDNSGLAFSVENTSSASEVKSSNPEIVRVNKGNTLTAVREGNATITISAGDVSKTFTVSVKTVPVESITLNKTNIDLQLGLKDSLEAVVAPENATDKSITWTSNNPEIVEISESGSLHALAVGSTSLICTSSDGVVAECSVSVFEVFPEKITLADKELKIETGQTATPVIKIEPDHANNKNFSCTIEDENIATIDKSGTITGKQDGETKLIITTENGINEAIPITIYHIPVTEVKIDASNIKYRYGVFSDHTIDIKAKLELITTVEPKDATYKDIVWESDNNDVIEIKNGKPSIKGTGNVILSAISHDETISHISFKVVNKDSINSTIATSLIIVIGVPSGIIVYKKRKIQK